MGRNSSQRKTLYRCMATDLLKHESIKTTLPKAKALRPIVEKIVTLGRHGDLSSRRQAAAYLTDKGTLRKLFDEIAERFKDRNGGYTRITKLPPRLGDNAALAVIELMPKL